MGYLFNLAQTHCIACAHVRTYVVRMYVYLLRAICIVYVKHLHNYVHMYMVQSMHIIVLAIGQVYDVGW